MSTRVLFDVKLFSSLFFSLFNTGLQAVQMFNTLGPDHAARLVVKYSKTA